jgi:hypothetical protein
MSHERRAKESKDTERTVQIESGSSRRKPVNVGFSRGKFL